MDRMTRIRADLEAALERGQGYHDAVSDVTWLVSRVDQLTALEDAVRELLGALPPIYRDIPLSKSVRDNQGSDADG